MGCNCVKSSSSRTDVSEILSNNDYKNTLVDYGEMSIDKDFFSGKTCGETANAQFLGKIPVHKTIAENYDAAVEIANGLGFPIGTATVIRYKEGGVIKMIMVISNMEGYAPLILK